MGNNYVFPYLDIEKDKKENEINDKEINKYKITEKDQIEPIGVSSPSAQIHYGIPDAFGRLPQDIIINPEQTTKPELPIDQFKIKKDDYIYEPVKSLDEQEEPSLISETLKTIPRAGLQTLSMIGKTAEGLLSVPIAVADAFGYRIPVLEELRKLYDTEGLDIALHSEDPSLFEDSSSLDQTMKSLQRKKFNFEKNPIKRSVQKLLELSEGAAPLALAAIHPAIPTALFVGSTLGEFQRELRQHGDTELVAAAKALLPAAFEYGMFKAMPFAGKTVKNFLFKTGENSLKLTIGDLTLRNALKDFVSKTISDTAMFQGLSVGKEAFKGAYGISQLGENPLQVAGAILTNPDAWLDSGVSALMFSASGAAGNIVRSRNIKKLLSRQLESVDPEVAKNIVKNFEIWNQMSLNEKLDNVLTLLNSENLKAKTIGLVGWARLNDIENTLGKENAEKLMTAMFHDIITGKQIDFNKSIETYINEKFGNIENNTLLSDINGNTQVDLNTSNMLSELLKKATQPPLFTDLGLPEIKGGIPTPEEVKQTEQQRPVISENQIPLFPDKVSTFESSFKTLSSKGVSRIASEADIDILNLSERKPAVSYEIDGYGIVPVIKLGDEKIALPYRIEKDLETNTYRITYLDSRELPIESKTYSNIKEARNDLFNTIFGSESKSPVIPTEDILKGSVPTKQTNINIADIAIGKHIEFSVDDKIYTGEIKQIFKNKKGEVSSVRVVSPDGTVFYVKAENINRFVKPKKAKQVIPTQEKELEQAGEISVGDTVRFKHPDNPQLHLDGSVSSIFKIPKDAKNPKKGFDFIFVVKTDDNKTFKITLNDILGHTKKTPKGKGVGKKSGDQKFEQLTEHDTPPYIPKLKKTNQFGDIEYDHSSLGVNQIYEAKKRYEELSDKKQTEKLTEQEYLEFAKVRKTLFSFVRMMLGPNKANSSNILEKVDEAMRKYLTDEKIDKYESIQLPEKGKTITGIDKINIYYDAKTKKEYLIIRDRSGNVKKIEYLPEEYHYTFDKLVNPEGTTDFRGALRISKIVSEQKGKERTKVSTTTKEKLETGKKEKKKTKKEPDIDNINEDLDKESDIVDNSGMDLKTAFKELLKGKGKGKGKGKSKEEAKEEIKSNARKKQNRKDNNKGFASVHYEKDDELKYTVLDAIELALKSGAKDKETLREHVVSSLRTEGMKILAEQVNADFDKLYTKYITDNGLNDLFKAEKKRLESKLFEDIEVLDETKDTSSDILDYRVEYDFEVPESKVERKAGEEVIEEALVLEEVPKRATPTETERMSFINKIGLFTEPEVVIDFENKTFKVKPTTTRIIDTDGVYILANMFVKYDPRHTDVFKLDEADIKKKYIQELLKSKDLVILEYNEAEKTYTIGVESTFLENASKLLEKIARSKLERLNKLSKDAEMHGEEWFKALMKKRRAQKFLETRNRRNLKDSEPILLDKNDINPELEELLRSFSVSGTDQIKPHKFVGGLYLTKEAKQNGEPPEVIIMTRKDEPHVADMYILTMSKKGNLYYSRARSRKFVYVYTQMKTDWQHFLLTGEKKQDQIEIEKIKFRGDFYADEKGNFVIDYPAIKLILDYTNRPLRYTKRYVSLESLTEAKIKRLWGDYFHNIVPMYEAHKVPGGVESGYELYVGKHIKKSMEPDIDLFVNRSTTRYKDFRNLSLIDPELLEVDVIGALRHRLGLGIGQVSREAVISARLEMEGITKDLKDLSEAELYKAALANNEAFVSELETNLRKSIVNTVDAHGLHRKVYNLAKKLMYQDLLNDFLYSKFGIDLEDLKAIENTELTRKQKEWIKLKRKEIEQEVKDYFKTLSRSEIYEYVFSTLEEKFFDISKTQTITGRRERIPYKDFNIYGEYIGSDRVLNDVEQFFLARGKYQFMKDDPFYEKFFKLSDVLNNKILVKSIEAELFRRYGDVINERFKERFNFNKLKHKRPVAVRVEEYLYNYIESETDRRILHPVLTMYKIVGQNPKNGNLYLESLTGGRLYGEFGKGISYTDLRRMGFLITSLDNVERGDIGSVFFSIKPENKGDGIKVVESKKDVPKEKLSVITLEEFNRMAYILSRSSNLVLYRTPDDMPEELKEVARSYLKNIYGTEDLSKLEGFTVGGHVAIILDNITLDRLPKVLSHELFHRGSIPFLTNELGKPFKLLIDALNKKLGTTNEFELQEVLATKAETVTKTSQFQNIKTALKVLASRLFGRELNITDEDVQVFLNRYIDYGTKNVFDYKNKTLFHITRNPEFGLGFASTNIDKYKDVIEKLPFKTDMQKNLVVNYLKNTDQLSLLNQVQKVKTVPEDLARQIVNDITTRVANLIKLPLSEFSKYFPVSLTHQEMKKMYEDLKNNGMLEEMFSFYNITLGLTNSYNLGYKFLKDYYGNVSAVISKFGISSPITYSLLYNNLKYTYRYDPINDVYIKEKRTPRTFTDLISTNNYDILEHLERLLLSDTSNRLIHPNLDILEFYLRLERNIAKDMHDTALENAKSKIGDYLKLNQYDIKFKDTDYQIIQIVNNIKKPNIFSNRDKLMAYAEEIGNDPSYMDEMNVASNYIATVGKLSGVWCFSDEFSASSLITPPNFMIFAYNKNEQKYDLAINFRLQGIPTLEIRGHNRLQSVPYHLYELVDSIYKRDILPMLQKYKVHNKISFSTDSNLIDYLRVNSKGKFSIEDRFYNMSDKDYKQNIYKLFKQHYEQFWKQYTKDITFEPIIPLHQRFDMLKQTIIDPQSITYKDFMFKFIDTLDFIIKESKKDNIPEKVIQAGLPNRFGLDNKLITGQEYIFESYTPSILLGEGKQLSVYDLIDILNKYYNSEISKLLAPTSYHKVNFLKLQIFSDFIYSRTKDNKVFEKYYKPQFFGEYHISRWDRYHEVLFNLFEVLNPEESKIFAKFIVDNFQNFLSHNYFSLQVSNGRPDVSIKEYIKSFFDNSFDNFSYYFDKDIYYGSMDQEILHNFKPRALDEVRLFYYIDFLTGGGLIDKSHYLLDDRSAAIVPFRFFDMKENHEYLYKFLILNINNPKTVFQEVNSIYEKLAASKYKSELITDFIILNGFYPQTADQGFLVNNKIISDFSNMFDVNPYYFLYDSLDRNHFYGKTLYENMFYDVLLHSPELVKTAYKNGELNPNMANFVFPRNLNIPTEGATINNEFENTIFIDAKQQQIVFSGLYSVINTIDKNNFIIIDDIFRDSNKTYIVSNYQNTERGMETVYNQVKHLLEDVARRRIENNAPAVHYLSDEKDELASSLIFSYYKDKTPGQITILPQSVGQNIIIDYTSNIVPAINIDALSRPKAITFNIDKSNRLNLIVMNFTQFYTSDTLRKFYNYVHVYGGVRIAHNININLNFNREIDNPYFVIIYGLNNFSKTNLKITGVSNLDNVNIILPQRPDGTVISRVTKGFIKYNIRNIESSNKKSIYEIESVFNPKTQKIYFSLAGEKVGRDYIDDFERAGLGERLAEILKSYDKVRPQTLFERIVTNFKNILKSFRVYPYLKKDENDIILGEIVRRINEVPMGAYNATEMIMKDYYTDKNNNKLSEDQIIKASVYITASDLLRSIDDGVYTFKNTKKSGNIVVEEVVDKTLSFGFSNRDEVVKFLELAKSKLDQQTLEFIDKRRNVLDGIYNDLIKHGIIDKNAISSGASGEYLRRIVITTHGLFNDFLNLGIGEKLKYKEYGFLKERTGSSLPYITDIRIADTAYILQAKALIEYYKLIDEIKSRYDRTPDIIKMIEEAKSNGEFITENPASFVLSREIKDKYGDVLVPFNLRKFRALSYTDIESGDFQGLLSLAFDRFSSELGIPKEALEKVESLMFNTSDYIIIPKRYKDFFENISNPKKESKIGQMFRNLTNLFRVAHTYMVFKVLPWQFNNMFGDVETALRYPKLIKEIPQALKDLWKRYMTNERLPKELEEELEKLGFAGTLGTGFFSKELSQVGLFKFNTLINTKTPQSFETLFEMLRNSGRNAVDAYKNFLIFRESVLRLAAYRFFKKLLQTNPNIKIYGASDKTLIDALKREGITGIDKAAQILSRQLIGDYGHLSEIGQYLRSHLIPFYSFMEVNFRRQLRSLFNAFKEDYHFSNRFVTPVLLLSKMFMLYSAILLWNKFRFPEDDEKLKAINAYGMYLITGKDKDNNLTLIPIQSIMQDFLEWFNFDKFSTYEEAYEYLKKQDYQKAVNVFANRPLSKIFSSIGILKIPYEIWAGKTVFPDIERGRPIRDVVEYLHKQVGLDPAYYLYQTKVKEIQPFNARRFAGGLVPYRYIDNNESDYNYSVTKILEFLKNKGVEYPEIEPLEKTNALYFYKRAIREGDKKVAEYWKNRYLELGGSRRGIKISFRKSDPIRMIPLKYRSEFFASLSPSDRARLANARRWWLAEIYANR